MPTSRLRKTIFALGTTLVALLGIEGIVRAVTWQVGRAVVPEEDVRAHLQGGGLAWDADLGWTWADLPIIGLQLNEYGFRYGKISKDKPPGTWRGFTIGDSQTHGAGVPGPESYTGLAEDKLRKLAPPGLTVELVNAACNGYTSLQALRLIQVRLLEFQPDLIVVDARTLDSERDDPLPRGVEVEWAHRLFWRSRTYLMLRLGIECLREGCPGPKADRSPVHPMDPESVWYGNHDLIARLARSHGIDVIFGNYPVWVGNTSTIRCEVQDAELPPGVPIARFCEALTNSGQAPSDLFFDNNHLKPLGNDLVSDALVAAILALWQEKGILPPDQ